MTRNQETETHDWIILVNMLYAMLRYYVIRRRFLSQKIPTELAVDCVWNVMAHVQKLDFIFDETDESI